MRRRCMVPLLVIMLACFQNCLAQEDQPKPSAAIRITSPFLRDEANLWKSPLHVRSEDLKWIVPLGIGAAALLKTDRNISGEIGESKSIQRPSRTVSQAGSFPLYVAPALLMVMGHVADDDRTARAGSVTL